jgi:hypothetical protein
MCANYALMRTAQDNRERYSPEAVDTVLDEFYVDDMAACMDTVLIATRT